MSRVAIVTDSASDLGRRTPLRRHGIVVVPARRQLRLGQLPGRRRPDPRGVLGADGRPGCAVPDDRRVEPGRVQGGVRGGVRRRRRRDRLRDRRPRRLSGTFKSARDRARAAARPRDPRRRLEERVDGPGLLAILATELAAAGVPADGIARTIEARADDALVAVCLDTLAYLKKGGRISGPQAAIGSLLGVKPIISVKDGLVETVDRVRTRTKARERAIEFIMTAPIERLSVLHTVSPDVEAFRDELDGPSSRRDRSEPGHRSSSSARRSARTSAPAPSGRRS